MLGLVKYWRGNGRLPRRSSDPMAGFNDFVFERMSRQSWTSLERACIDKQHAKLFARALCPEVKTSGTLAVLPVSTPADVGNACSFLLSRSGRAEVAKPTHGSGAVLFLRQSPTPQEIRSFCGRASQSYYRLSRESQYKGLERKIILEEDLSVGGAPPVDYKFFCVHGEVLFCQVDVDRFSRHRRCLVTPDFRWIDVRFSHDWPSALPRKPGTFDAMVKIAEKLSRGFRFVRLDLYSTGGEVYFGEFTFAPEGGTGSLSSEAFGIWVMERIRSAGAGPEGGWNV
ncbi:ATP-grasp fold amidoligase family protein [Aestuariivirga sp.]|uniref:ATP-grasp fold amidoligase family protein n=1 Tax=Aestuariivirga sp. TaxID=2650926 RepID=UPI00391C65EB